LRLVRVIEPSDKLLDLIYDAATDEALRVPALTEIEDITASLGGFIGVKDTHRFVSFCRASCLKGIVCLAVGRSSGNAAYPADRSWAPNRPWWPGSSLCDGALLATWPRLQAGDSCQTRASRDHVLAPRAKEPNPIRRT
jgi:hypothetical protein